MFLSSLVASASSQSCHSSSSQRRIHLRPLPSVFSASSDGGTPWRRRRIWSPASSLSLLFSQWSRDHRWRRIPSHPHVAMVRGHRRLGGGVLDGAGSPDLAAGATMAAVPLPSSRALVAGSSGGGRSSDRLRRHTGLRLRQHVASDRGFAHPEPISNKMTVKCWTRKTRFGFFFETEGVGDKGIDLQTNDGSSR